MVFIIVGDVEFVNFLGNVFGNVVRDKGQASKRLPVKISLRLDYIE